MRARSRNLRLAGASLPGPLLIPSISSKGFPLIDSLSEAGLLAETVVQDLTTALLISAYDLHHELLPDAKRLLSSGYGQTMYSNPNLLVVDSGGYELNPYDYESGEVRRDRYAPRDFTRAEHGSVISQLPATRPTLVVSYDQPVSPDPESSGRPSFREQREVAQAFFASRPDVGSDFLLKPEGKAQYLDIRSLTLEAQNLRVFDVIGVTEKELGRTLLDRLASLARLRDLLNDQGCADTPIHVFGCLDPVFTPLFFMAGGEIFDGLSWLRYAYMDNVSVHPDQLGVMLGTIDDGEETRQLRRLMSNLAQLGKLRHGLARWYEEPHRFEHLGLQHERLREIYESLGARLAQRG